MESSFYTMPSLSQYVLLIYFSLLCSFSPKSAMAFSIHLPFHKHHNKPLPHSDPSIKLPLPIDSTFNLPSSIPNWPPGNGFASGAINLGGLQVTQITSFTKIWSSQEGGINNQGVSIYEPSNIPNGYFSLGYYAQTNNKPLYGFVLVGKDLTNDPNKGALVKPVDYTLVWTSQSLTIKQDTPVYIWLPVPPNGYSSMGHIITLSAEKPPLDKIRCVRSDFTDDSQTNGLIWGSNGVNIHATKPVNVGVKAMGVGIGTFTTIAQNGFNSITSCLKNAKANLSYMPNFAQVQALAKAYFPYIYLHPNEEYHPSTVNWFFSNGALLYKKGDESNPIPIQTNGSNLPLDGANDGSYWLDLPINDKEKERVKKGDLRTAVGYIHIKPMLGATFTDISIWVFYPFNGAARAKVGSIKAIGLGKIGEHVGDWEHMTLRISNFNGELRSVYFSEHSKGSWVDSPDVKFQNGNRVVGYVSLHGHAMYPKEGLVMQGGENVGIRDDTAEGGLVLDVGSRFEVIAAEYDMGVVEPDWLKYMNKWGPKITYDAGVEIGKIARFLPGKLKSDLMNLLKGLPSEVLGEEGPTGPMVKNNWYGDETS
ncbi:hypothetical protein V2J09_001134 [Rumex salicifolius]